MPGLKALIIATAGAVAFAAAAQAADMPRLPPTIRTVTPDTTPTWYLRADVGFRSTSIGSVISAGGFPELTSNQIGNPMFGGIGAGFKFGQLRTDITADYSADASYQGVGVAASATAQVQTFTGLVNLYYDLGTWFGATPYVGAGAGAAYTTVSQYQSNTVPPLSQVGSHSSYHFAWALMAGLSYQFVPRLSLDLGYRFLDQGDAVSGSDAFGHLTLKNLQSHEMRIGLRWTYESPGSYVR